MMSTTAVKIKGPNKALFRTTALVGSALIWGTLGYLALTYVPQYDKPIEFELPPITTVVRAPPPPVLPPVIEPVKRDPPTIVSPAPATLSPPITTRATPNTNTNPLKGELPVGPAASTPMASGIDGAITNTIPWVEPVLITPPIAEPIIAPPIPVVLPPPVAKLVINPVKSSGNNPIFPNRALDQGISGEVTLSFTVSPTGTVENINVTGEEPSGYGFARAARTAIQGWTFQPQTIDGVPVAYPARYTISFKLED